MNKLVTHVDGTSYADDLDTVDVDVDKLKLLDADSHERAKLSDRSPPSGRSDPRIPFV